MEHKPLTKQMVLRQLASVKPELTRRFGISKIGLFGSFARGDVMPDNDIDIVIEQKKPDMFAIVHIKEILENKFLRPVDVVYSGTFTNPYLKKRIGNEAEYV
ncbi:MAG: nucleotidyltransferase domain-containing protein [Spirochaetia bacterium]|jgi:predicted nucleotidyltransferase|nr:nucleotidyltransferase domain-containing protein [Spirochaetia bacterium]